ncbi:NADAR family protein [Candidatus Woesearchaeota archaeon]|nr:NADAR family protein [Candidatus Woesearchaeota archaeon]
MVLQFCDDEEEYGCFSNFSLHSFVLDGKIWSTGEHYYQAQKHTDHAYISESIRNVHAPGEAKKMAHHRNPRPDWEEDKDDVMRKVILAKFTQNTDLTDILLSTGSEVLVEDSPTDAYWGCGPDGDGENKLGRILMEVRSVIGLSQYWGPDILFNYYARDF